MEHTMVNSSPYPMDYSDIGQRSFSEKLRSLFQSLLVHVGLPVAGVNVHTLGEFPENGPFIIAVNHASHLDTPVILKSLSVQQRKSLKIAASSSYFFTTRNLLHRLAVKLFGLVPATGKKMLETANNIRDDKSIMLIFPEGTRSRNGKIGRFCYGIGVVHRESRVPVIPVSISGTRKLMPAGRKVPRRGSVFVRIGEPISMHIADADTITQTVQNRVEQLIPATNN